MLRCRFGFLSMYRRILLAYDGSVPGKCALREGARLAQLSGARVCLLAVVHLTTGIVAAEGTHPGVISEQTRACQNMLWEGAARLRRMGLEPEARLSIGHPSREICAVAREFSADLVVVGHRRRGAQTRCLPSSVAAYLADHLECSILVAGSMPDTLSNA